YWGYGALGVEQYLKEFNITSMSSQNANRTNGYSFTHLNEKDDTAKMTGSADTYDYVYGYVQGEGKYSAYLTTSGTTIGCDVNMPYTNFCDFKLLTPDGDYLKTIVMTGKSNTFAGEDLTKLVISGNMYGTMTMSDCMYNGSICYGNSKGDGYLQIGTKTDGTSGVVSGYYLITSSSYSARQVSWEVGEE
ncbi:MAG: hypothetical protein K5839_06215, partial [Treponemataceae bacterium]|nr:hypothetical protein [Treponemataceae bacterium]